MPTQPGFRYRRSAVTEARHGQERVVSIRRRPRRKLIGVLVVIILLVPAGLLAARSLWGTMTGTIADPEISAEGGPEPSLDPNNLFDGTPANDFTEASEGVRLAAAKKVGGWAAKDVQTALNSTKTIVLRARTDPAVLGGNSTAYVKALAVNAQAETKKSIASGTDTLGYVTKLAAGYSLAEPIRAAGTISVKGGSLNQLIVTANVVWIYPLAGALPKASTGAGVRLVVLHTVESYEWYPSRRFTDDDQGARPGAGKRAVFNANCQQYDKGKLALPTTATHDPAAGAEKVFALTTSPDAFPTGC